MHDLLIVAAALLSLMTAQIIAIPLVASQIPLKDCVRISHGLRAGYSRPSVISVYINITAGAIGKITLRHCLCYHIGILNGASFNHR